MVIIDQLRISDDASKLFINAHVNTATNYTNVYIKSITITSADQVSETSTGIPTKYIYKTSLTTTTTSGTGSTATSTTSGKKEVDLVLGVNDFIKSWGTTVTEKQFKTSEMSTTLFFVYFELMGTPSSTTPCGLDKTYTLGVTFDEGIIHNKIMSFTRELANTCSIPNGFIDLILLKNALESSIETEHYIDATKYYNMLIGGSGTPYIKNCNCHG